MARIGYAMGGRNIDPDDPMCYAKEVDGERVKLYFIKRYTDGPLLNRFVNPLDPDYTNGDEKIYDARRDKHRLEFDKVTEGAFKAYKKFLETSNDMYISQALRG